MIILRQREFGNKENKAAQRQWRINEAKKDKNLVETAKKHHNVDGLTRDNSNQVGPTFIIASDDNANEFRNYQGNQPRKLNYESQLLRESRKKDNSTLNNEFSEDVKNIDQSINYKANGEKRINKFTKDGPSERMKFLKKNKDYKRNLKSNKTKRDFSKFVKDNKKGLAIGGTALGTAALVGGGIAINRARKKKKAVKEENDNTKK